MNKTLKVMTSAALLAGVVAPVATTTVSANSDNIVTKVPYVADDYKSTSSATPITSLIIKDKDVVFTTNDTFRISLPSGVKWVKDEAADGFYTAGEYIQADAVTAADPGAGARFKIVSVTDQDLELQPIGYADTLNASIPLFFEVDGAEGELKLTVDPKGSTITGGQYAFAVVASGKTSATVPSVKTIGDGGSVDTIRIDELSIGSVNGNDATATRKVTLTLPSKFKWDLTAPATVELTGGFAAAGVVADTTPTIAVPAGTDGRKVEFTIDFDAIPTALGSVYIKGLKINADSDAPYGDVSIDVDGDKFTSQELLVAKYNDYGSEVKVKDSDLPTLLAGRNDADVDDLELAELEVKELVPGTWIDGRQVKFEFPTWVKVVGFDVTETNMAADSVRDALRTAIAGDDNEFEFSIPAASDASKARSFKVKYYVSSEADATGDVTVNISGRAGVEGEATLGKVVSPVSVEVNKTDVRTGIKGQSLSDITITEATKGAMKAGQFVTLTPEANSGTLSGTPVVEVEEGNIEIDKNTVKIVGGVLQFQVKSESTRPAKLKISGVKYDANRAVPEGDVNLEVGGAALIQNHYTMDNNANAGEDSAFTGAAAIKEKAYVQATDYDATISVGEFDKDYVTKATVATVVTPAEGNVTVEEVQFTIGATTYTVGGTEKTMDVAPFVEAGRTYMPIRYVAEAVGVNSDSIFWDQATQTATLIKGDRVVQLTAGSKSLKVNGASITMDAAAKIKDGRTVLPVRFVGQAMGATVDYDATAQTVTVK